MRNNVKFYDLEKKNQKKSISDQRAVINRLKQEMKNCNKRGDYLQEMTLSKVVNRLQSSLDNYIVENFPIRY